MILGGVAACVLPFAIASSCGAAACAADSPVAPAGDMVFVPHAARVVGTSPEEREALARRFDCDPTWLNDDLDKHAAQLEPFWIDRSPVTNEQYGRFVAATGERAPWLGGRYPAEAADQPVAGVTQVEAEAYAKWAGMRLPTAEEWEAAAQSGKAGLFPWGDDWPGLVKHHGPEAIPDWQRPWTDRVGTGGHGRSAAGMEDFVQQVCEWTSTTKPHHDTTFAAVKGTSWLNEDAVNFRTAATSWALAIFPTPWIGFRCALDGDKSPLTGPRGDAHAAAPASDVPPSATSGGGGAGIQVCRLRDAPPEIGAHLLDWSRMFLGRNREAPIPQSRGFLLHARALGPWPVCLFLSEALYWDKSAKMAGCKQTDPILQDEPAAEGRSAYSLHFPEIDVTYTFVPGDDRVDLLTTIINKTDRTGEFSTTSCFSLTNHPWFYDCEMVRTYMWTRDAGFVLLRQIPRPGDCIRWIQPSDASRYGGPGTPATMAVVSRDGQWIFASARFEPGAAAEVSGNTWLNCLHTEAPVMVDGHATRTTRQRLYFLRGDLKQLQTLILQDMFPR